MPDRESLPGQSEESDCPFFVSPQALSDRQREVLWLAALGCTDREIASRLTISVYTARDHLRAVRERLGARNTTHAVVIALFAGMIGSGMSGQGPGEREGS